MTGGHMFRTERDEHGLIRAVPTDEPYLQDAPQSPEPKPEPKPEPARWYIAKRTDPEPGAAPTYDELTLDEKTAWFGYVDEDDPDDYGERVWFYLCDWIARTFPGVHLMRSPALTGCLCIEHTLPWASDRGTPYRYPTLPEPLGRLVAATTTPHRMELLTLPSRPALREVRVYDARISYAAHLRSLPVVTEECDVTHDHEPHYERYRPGRYLCTVTVPEGWHHIGLARRALPEGYGYDYPTRPGLTFATWLEEPELRLLDDSGWVYTVQERILYAPKGTRGSDPLRVFCERVFPELAKLEAGAPLNPARRAYRHALRALLTQPVGLWHRGRLKSRRAVPDARAVRFDAGEELESEGGQLYAVTRSPLHGPVSRWRRPEWAAAVYGYEHAAVMRQALRVPRSALLAIRGDGLVLADHDPKWTDTGKIGCYRLKECRDFGAMRPAPHTEGERAALEREVRRG